MAMSAKKQALWWGGVAIVVLTVLYGLGNVLLPYIIGCAIAYFLDPVADRLEATGLSRGLSTAIIAVLVVMIFVVLILLVVPTFVRQIAGLFDALPGYARALVDFLTSRFPSLLNEDSQLNQQLASIAETLQGKAGGLANAIWGSAMGLVNVLVLFLIVPVVAVYMLMDWDRMIAHVNELLPREHAPTIRRLAGEIDATLSGFIRGQGTVCLILGSYYAIALMIAGLQYGLAIGAVAGLISFIPYVGAIVGGGLALGVALFQFWGEWWMILLIYAIFQSGQMVEGNILTPKLVGSSVGLHPVWLLLALSVFSAAFGFVGMLVAVPLAAVIGVLARFSIQQYKSSPLYRGRQQ